MSLLGNGAVAIWHDIEPAGRDQFYAWHGNEHMPERVGIPGFLRGRRYIATQADLEFFNLYEVATPEVLIGADYQDRLNHPTPWTLSTVRHFRNVARSLCRVPVSLGRGQGALATTCRYDVAPEHASEHIRQLARTLLPAILANGSVAGAHLLVADTESSAIDTAERKARGEPNRIPSWILIVEGWGDDEPFVDLCRTALSDSALLSAEALAPPVVGYYRLQATIEPSDLSG